MASNLKYLLSTRPLPKPIVDEAATKGVMIDQLSFISTEAIQDETLFQKIKSLATEQYIIVFTSMNAVNAVKTHVSSAENWKIYSIGNTTRKLIEEAWGSECLVAVAENAQRLGERLADDEVKEVVFFCGNIRRDELPNKVRSEGGTVEEVVVYNTQETPVKLEKEYDGILFFSPSAVTAFYKQNIPGKDTVLFAIGKTTAEMLRQHKAKKIIVANNNDKVEMTKDAIDYLNNEE